MSNQAKLRREKFKCVFIPKASSAASAPSQDSYVGPPAVLVPVMPSAPAASSILLEVKNEDVDVKTEIDTCEMSG